MRSSILPSTILLVTLALSGRLLAQSPRPAPDPGQKNPVKPADDPTAATTPAFSAEKYARTLRMTPGGKPVLLSQAPPIKIARSAEGKIRVQSRVEECPEPPCTTAVTLFDPVTQTVTHWGEGGIASHGSVIFPIASSRAHEIEDDTSSLPDESSTADTDGATVTTQDLGQKIIEGISSHGTRTTVTLPALARGNQDTLTTTHEVWTSTEMNLVLKVIDAKQTGGDPNVEQSIRGLEHISSALTYPSFVLPMTTNIRSGG